MFAHHFNILYLIKINKYSPITSQCFLKHVLTLKGQMMTDTLLIHNLVQSCSFHTIVSLP
jgi:hypothetical protein